LPVNIPDSSVALTEPLPLLYVPFTDEPFWVRERTAMNLLLSAELYVVFHVPDHDVFVDGAAIVATVAGVDGVTATVVAAGVVVTGLVLDVLVQPVVIIIIQIKPARIIASDLFAGRSLHVIFNSK
jgi:hypothetical protein